MPGAATVRDRAPFIATLTVTIGLSGLSSGFVTSLERYSS
jgi:hypothetical protein